MGLIEQVQSLLLTELAGVTALGGRVYARPLKRSGNRATPEAYDALGVPKLSVVVLDGGETENPAWYTSGLAYLSIWMHGPDTDTTRALMVDTLAPAIEVAMLNAELVGIAGTGIEAKYLDRFGCKDDPDNKDAIFDYVRFACITLRSNA